MRPGPLPVTVAAVLRALSSQCGQQRGRVCLVNNPPALLITRRKERSPPGKRDEALQVAIPERTHPYRILRYLPLLVPP